MFKLIGKIFSMIFYVILMAIGLAMFIAFFVIAFLIVSQTGDFFETFQTWLNNTFELNITEIGWIEFMLAAPFLIMSFIGLAIVILTQRTANINRRLNSTNRKAKKISKEIKEEKENKKKD